MHIQMVTRACLHSYKFRDNPGSHILYLITGLDSGSAKLLFYTTIAAPRVYVLFCFSLFLSFEEVILTGNNFKLGHAKLGKEAARE